MKYYYYKKYFRAVKDNGYTIIFYFNYPDYGQYRVYALDRYFLLYGSILTDRMKFFEL